MLGIGESFESVAKLDRAEDEVKRAIA